jgi:ABC-type multidrug transport system ATPase subunit
MLRLLADLRDQGRTIVLTTHQRELAEPIADVLLTMQNGALAQVASTHQPMETP